MSDAREREWRFYVGDMIAFGGKVLAYTHGLDQVHFVASGLNYGATLRNLELIGGPPPISRTKSAPLIPKFPGG